MQEYLQIYESQKVKWIYLCKWCIRGFEVSQKTLQIVSEIARYTL